MPRQPGPSVLLQHTFAQRLLPETAPARATDRSSGFVLVPALSFPTALCYPIYMLLLLGAPIAACPAALVIFTYLQMLHRSH